jgi:hypothetical protein
MQDPLLTAFDQRRAAGGLRCQAQQRLVHVIIGALHVSELQITIKEMSFAAWIRASQAREDALTGFSRR